MPFNEAEFKHRIGRSGRFGREGVSLSLISEVESNKIYYIKQMIQNKVLNDIQISNMNFIRDKKLVEVEEVELGKRQ